MTEKSFIKKLIKKYSKKFEVSLLSGLDLRIGYKEDIKRECEKFINEQINEIIPEVKYNEEGYLDYYKTIQLLARYYEIKNQIYNNKKWHLRTPNCCENYCPPQDW